MWVMSALPVNQGGLRPASGPFAREENRVVRDPRVFKEAGLPALQPYVGPEIQTVDRFLQEMRESHLIEGAERDGRLKRDFLLRIGDSGMHSRVMGCYPSLLYYLGVAYFFEHIPQTTVEPFIHGALLVTVQLRDGQAHCSVRSRNPWDDSYYTQNPPPVFKDHRFELEELARRAAQAVHFSDPVEVMILLARDEQCPYGQFNVLKVKGESACKP